MKAPYAATFGDSKITHALKAPWPYGDAHLTCGKTGWSRIAYSPAKDIEITCKTCLSVPRELSDAYAWVATAHLEQSFAFPHEDASELVNRAMSGKGFRGGLAIAGNSRPAVPVEFTTHQGKRRWQITAYSVGFVSGTMISIREIRHG